MKDKRLVRNGFTGVMVILWLCLSFFNSTLEPPEKPTETDQKEETSQNQSEQDYQFKLTEAVQNSIQINVDFHSFLVEEILNIEGMDSWHGNHAFKTKITKSFRILFEKIISTNAP